MDFQAIWTVLVVAGILCAFALNLGSADYVMFAALIALLLSGVITVKEALSGFSNEAMITVAFLFIVSAAIQQTGALNQIVYRFLGTNRNQGLRTLLLKMMLPIAALSAFLNNTAIVAIFLPVIKKWTDTLRLSPSKFFIPLSFATVLGGCITLLGTSTNLVVQGLLKDRGLPGFGMFDLAWVGIPMTLAGIFYLATLGEKLLPDRKDIKDSVDENTREYVVEMRVRSDCPLIGKDLKEAGLRNLRGLFLIDIERDGKTLGPVSSQEVIAAEDRLIFAGITSAVLDLQEIPGLVLAQDEVQQKDYAQMQTNFIEAVVSSNSPILGKTIKECQFRTKYGAGIVAVHRNGERISGKIGDIRVSAGDTLLLFAPQDFVENWKDSQDFYLISYLKDAPTEKSKRQGALVLIVTLLMIFGSVFGELEVFKVLGNEINIFHTSALAVLILLIFKCLRGQDARQAVRWEVLIAIACSFGISKALEKTGVAAFFADHLISATQTFGPWGVLVGIYLLTNLFTELMSNNASAALVLPIALSAADKLGVNPMPFVVALTLAASCGFATPIGYQTHLMVQGAGGYKFSDYVKVGLPLNLICLMVAVSVIPLIWKF